MGSEQKVIKRKTGEMSDMAEFICSVLGSYEIDIYDHGQDYREFSSYKTRTFEIHVEGAVEVRYKG
ncbi:hypothetical protein HY494_02455 [Candidatus Woesearchaeota archaeon]|nr:hypothetical protein [Candidatus Woesearchaeota archaeon]